VLDADELCLEAPGHGSETRRSGYAPRTPSILYAADDQPDPLGGVLGSAMWAGGIEVVSVLVVEAEGRTGECAEMHASHFFRLKAEGMGEPLSCLLGRDSP